MESFPLPKAGGWHPSPICLSKHVDALTTTVESDAESDAEGSQLCLGYIGASVEQHDIAGP